MNNKQTFLALIFLVALLIASSLVGTLFPSSPKDRVSADSTPDRLLFGYAWSSNLGWINFGNAADSYNVYLTPDSSGNFEGSLHGYAWANPRDSIAGTNNIGWLVFDPADLSNAPEAPYQAARIEKSGLLTGWARFCVGAASNCVGTTNPAAGGWGGWVKLSGTSADGSTYGVHKVKNQAGHEGLSGYAWGGDVAGWINFDPWFVANGGSSGGGTGECDPLRQVCIGDTTSDTLTINCYPEADRVQLPSTGGVDVNWTASVLRGKGPFTYSWNGPGSTSGPTATSHYTDVGDKTVSVVVTDNGTTPPRTAQRSCLVNIYSGGGTATSTGTGVLHVVDGRGVMYISEQATGHPAASLVSSTILQGQIENTGDGAVNDLHITSLVSTKAGSSNQSLSSIMAAADAGGYTPQCSLVVADHNVKPADNWQPCGNVSEDLPSGKVAYLRIQIPTYLKAVADNSPYKVVLGGTTTVTNPDGSSSAASVNNVELVFKYLVGTYTPQ